MRVDGRRIKDEGEMQEQGKFVLRRPLRAGSPAFRILMFWWVCCEGAQAASNGSVFREYIEGVTNKDASIAAMKRQLLQTKPSEGQERDHAFALPMNLCLIALVGFVVLSSIACLVKHKWGKSLPPSLPPEPWLLVEVPSSKLPSPKRKRLEGSQDLGSSIERCAFKPSAPAAVFPIVPRSLRATRSCSLRKVIDCGRFGCVEKGQFVDATGKRHDVAVKVAIIPVGQDPDILLESFEAEMECFERIPLHPNVVRCFGGRLGDPTDPGTYVDEIFLVEELMETNLRKIISGERMPWETWTYGIVLHIFSDIAAALEHLHAHNVSHCDLKPENVLVKVVDDTFPLQVKLADFGCSQIKQKTYATARYVGTKMYMAPEIAWSPYFSLIASGKVDIFSLGIMMWEILTGGDIICGEVPTGRPLTIQAVLDCPSEQRWPIADHHPAELSKLIWSCMEFDSSKRPTAKMVSEALACMMPSAWNAKEVVRERRVSPQ